MDDAFHITSLPDDPASLKSIITSLARQRDEASRQRDEQIRELHSQERKIAELEERARQLEQDRQRMEIEKLRLEMELLRLKKWYYGPRADRLSTPGDVAQMLLGFAGELEARPVDPADLPAGDTPATVPEPKDVRRVNKGRRNLADFENLPVIRREHDLPDDQKPCPCCGNTREKIGERYINRTFTRAGRLDYSSTGPAATGSLGLEASREGWSAVA